MSNLQQLRFLSAGHFFHHYLLAVLPVAAISIQAEWGLSTGEAVALGTPLYAFLALATLPAGWLGDIFPRQWLMALCLFGSGGAAILAGLSVGPITLTLALALLGTFSALYHPVGLAMIADCAERPGPAYARNGVWGNAGGGVAAALSALFASYFHWQIAFVLPGLVGLCLAVCYVWFGRTAGNRPVRADAAAEDGSKLAGPKSVAIALLVFLVTASVYNGLVAGAITYPLPRFIENRAFAGGDLLIIGGSTSLVLILGSVTQLLSGWGVERCRVKTLLAGLFATQILALVAAAEATGPAIVVFLGLFHGLLYAWFPLTAVLIGRHIPATLRARVISIEYVAGFAAVAGAVPLVAWLYDLGVAPSQQLWIVILSAALVFIAVAGLPRRDQRSTSEQFE